MPSKKQVKDSAAHSHVTHDSERPSKKVAFPIVGVGASAGGLAAFEAFFSGMPADIEPGMAFVLVQHLAPDHNSILSELIRRCTRMQVFEVEDGMKVHNNCVYIIPPNRDLAFLNYTLQLLEPIAPRGQRLPIDYFFRTLAEDQGEHAIGIVLSGMGSDGTLGLRAIKGQGGMAMAQNPESSEFDGMPRSAIATGLVDYELPPAEMPAQLIAYTTHAFGKLGHTAEAPLQKIESAIKKVFVLLRTQTGHDFSQYKPSTINRRIERRMAVHQIDAIDNYLKYLQQTPAEVEALFRDLLIGVTNFFRDPQAFQALEEQVIAKLFADRPAGAVIRVWSAGCSSGEEAYSIAILLKERMEMQKQSYTVQVFATDIDSRTIATARAGIYPASIAADITPERLARFFIPEPGLGGYQIHKNIRDMIVFSKQDVIQDPPFSRLDLISCRNMLIYMGSELQKKLIPLFHFALKPGGMLFLGNSEGIGDYTDLFTMQDRKAKIFQRKEDHHSAQRAPGRYLPSIFALNSTNVLDPQKGASPTKLPLRELTEQALLQQLAPPSALVDAHGDIFYLHGRTGMYLEPAPGESGVNNILHMAREGLRRELTTALRKAVSSGQTAHGLGVKVKTNGHFTAVDLSVCPVVGSLTPPGAPLYLVIFEPAPEASGAPVQDNVAFYEQSHDAEAQIESLKLELRDKDEYLQAANEELESANEELKSSNEEMQSVNEELQSTNEELETSKEELQSLNEELATVNSELQTKVIDLSRANNDMNNLLAGTGIGTVFVDHSLRILRFTPAASAITNLILSDLGRPVSHIASNLSDYAQLVPDLQEVLKTLIPKEVDVKTHDGNWYTMRIQPYRTLDNVIEGAVISFVNITEAVQVKDALRMANEHMRLAVVVRDAHDAITVHDLNGRILAWNPGAHRIYGWTEAEALQMKVGDRIPPHLLREEALAKVRQLSQNLVLHPYRTQRLSKDGAIVEICLTATALVNEAGEVYAIATTERVISDAIEGSGQG